MNQQKHKNNNRELDDLLRKAHSFFSIYEIESVPRNTSNVIHIFPLEFMLASWIYRKTHIKLLVSIWNVCNWVYVLCVWKTEIV